MIDNSSKNVEVMAVDDTQPQKPPGEKSILWRSNKSYSVAV